MTVLYKEVRDASDGEMQGTYRVSVCVLPWVRWETTSTVVCFCALSLTHARHSWELQRFFLMGLWSFSVNKTTLLIKIDSTVLLQLCSIIFYASQSRLYAEKCNLLINGICISTIQ